MTVFARALTILLTCCRYRLDRLVPIALPWPVRILLWFFPEPQQNKNGDDVNGNKSNRGQRLRQACEDLGPIFVKFGQLLSTRPDLIPPDIIEELQHLQDNVTPFDPDHFHRIVARELEQPVDRVFAEFDNTPLASASVAQVHAAMLPNGKAVVVKAIRPGIEKTITKDIRLLLWIAKRLEKWLTDGPRLKPVEIVEDYRTTIFDELDLQREAANASQLRRHFLHSPLLYVPEVYWDYCNANVMVMERIYGIPVTDIDALEAQQTNMKKLAERGVEIFFCQVFEHNFFHADMHPGNIFVSTEHPDQPQYICVDMAIVGSLTREDQYYLARNLLAMFQRDYRLVAELHVQSGWVPKDTKVNEFEAAVRTVCEPIFEKPLAEISFGKVLINLFSTARRFNMEVQPQLVLLQKTLLNIEGLGRQIYPQLDLWTTARPYLENWLKNRFHPRTLYRELKRYGPEWLEKFPDIPMKLYNNLDNLQQAGELMPALQQAAEDYHQHKLERRRQWPKKLLAGVLAAGAIVVAWPELHEQLAVVNPLAWLLGVTAVVLWVLS